MALVIVVMLIAGGFAAGFTAEQGWGLGMIAFRGLGTAFLLGALVAALTWWRLRRMRRELSEVE